MPFFSCMFRLCPPRFTHSTNVYTIPRIVKALNAHFILYFSSELSMDWRAKGFLPGFLELIIKHFCTVRELLRALAIAKVLSLARLKSIAPSGSCEVPERKFLSLVHSTGTIHHLPPSHIEEAINGDVANWDATRQCSGAPRSQGPFPFGDRDLTLRAGRS